MGAGAPVQGPQAASGTIVAMNLLHQALRAGNATAHAAPTAAAQRRAGGVVVAGAGGPLGSAVLEQALACGAYPRVTVLVTQPLGSTLRAFQALELPDLAAPAPDLDADTALVVLDRTRGLHGREAAFLRPLPDTLAALGRWLQAGGVRHLVLVLPHAPGLLPAALKAGLATLDEQALAALGFEQLVVVRPARAAGGAADAAGAALQRLAQALLAQLHWMVPLREQPVRAEKVAQFALALARLLPQARPGARVADAALVWQHAQGGDGDALLAAWLAGAPLPALRTPRQRL